MTRPHSKYNDSKDTSTAWVTLKFHGLKKSLLICKKQQPDRAEWTSTVTSGFQRLQGRKREREYYLVRMVVDKKRVEHMAVDTRSAVSFIFFFLKLLFARNAGSLPSHNWRLVTTV